MLHFQLDGGTQAHLCVGKRAIDFTEFGRQGDAGISLFGRIDPQIEQRARAGELASRLFVGGELVFEYLESALRALRHQGIERLGPLLIILLGQLQGLPAFLVFAVLSERGQLLPALTLLLEAFKIRFDLFQPLVQPAGTLSTHGFEHVGEGVVCVRAHGATPGLAHIRGAAVLARELRGHLLHLAEPLAGLLVEARHRVVGLAGSAGHQLRPPVHRLLPLAGGLRRCGRAQAALAHRLSPGVPVLPGHRLEIALVVEAVTETVAEHSQLSQATPRS